MAIDTRCCLNCALVNIQLVGNKTYEIWDYINENKLDVLMLTEIWLNKNDTAKIRDMMPETYTFLHAPRGDGKGGGGLGFLSQMPSLR